MFIFTVGGRLRSMVGTMARTSRTIVSGLPVGVDWMPMKTAPWPLIITEELVACAPRSMVAISPRRTRLPSLALTTICLN